jgi:hypothetical protein
MKSLMKKAGNADKVTFEAASRNEYNNAHCITSQKSPSFKTSGTLMLLYNYSVSRRIAVM